MIVNDEADRMWKR